jgi:hypothetical protein
MSCPDCTAMAVLHVCPVPDILSQLSSLSCPLGFVHSQVSCLIIRVWLYKPDRLLRLPSPSCPVTAFLSLFSSPNCPFQLSYQGILVPNYLSPPSCPCCHVLIILSDLFYLSRLPCPSYLISAVFAGLSCPGCPEFYFLA